MKIQAMNAIKTRRDNARDLLLADRLAGMGARPRLLQILTSISRAASIQLCSLDGRASASRYCRDPIHWLETRDSRLIEALRFWMCYEVYGRVEHPAERIACAYTMFVNTTPETDEGPSLEINHCHDVIRLMKEGQLLRRECHSCDGVFLTAAELRECPACRLEASCFCRSCGVALPPPAHESQVGRPRQYCANCQDSRSRRRHQRAAREQRVLHSHTDTEFTPAEAAVSK
ncbi:MAG: FlhC family transcriptional regulator [Gammaproteobacteria bacterium]